MSASPAVVAAVQQAMTAHLADFDIEVAAQRCRCGLAVGDSVQAEVHRAEMVAAAAEAEALEAAAMTFHLRSWIDVLDGGIVARRRSGTAVARWLWERAETVREGQ